MQAQMDMVEVGVFRLQWTQQRWETSIQAQFEAMEMRDKHLCSSRHGGGGWQACRLEWIWWRWE